MSELTSIEGQQLPSIMQPSEEAIAVYDKPLSIRVMCQGEPANHKFSLGGLTDEGKVMYVQLVGVKEYNQIRPSEKYDEKTDFIQWLGLMSFEGDSERKMWADCVFASSSCDAAKDLLKIIEAKQKGSIPYVIKCSIEPAENKKKQKFGVVRFELMKSSKHDLADLKEVLQSAALLNPNAFNTFNELSNIDADA